MTFEKTPTELFNTTAGIGILDEKSAEIKLILNSGEAHPNFPLGGTTPFVTADLLEDGNTEVVVGNKSEIYVYELTENKAISNNE